MSFLAAIAFDPAIRGVLVVLVGVVVLFGSIYLLVATNTGARSGFLIAMAALMGWCFSMGIFWWIYGIGMIGEAPTWMEREINFNRDATPVTPQLAELAHPDPEQGELPTAEELLSGYEQRNPEIRQEIEASEGEGFVPRSLTQVVTLVPELKRELDEELGNWRILPESDARRGEAVASSDELLAEAEVFGQNTGPSDYTVKDVYFYGGKDTMEPETVPGERNPLEAAWNRVASVFQVQNPTLYAAVTLQKNVEVEVPLGEAPPPAQIDESASTVTVVMQRNLGNRRLIPFLFTLFTGVLFFVFCWMLHTKDRRTAEVRAAWSPAEAG
jgi:hypothetical protein